MEINLKKFKDEQLVKDAKVLNILKMKDNQIEELQAKCVKQEADYGRLAQTFQEQKRQLSILEESEESLNVIV